ncbi:hypothetical protein GN244_ATG10533 [Phytophthora infestans]|uniref:Uncharacterized protein n=1 Tax=Phytophthora infestans TaxID=4787 RepID=A0A833T1F9_PHYIN|nr:hypothetical protein GN244_ATG10533 [Phytophthora infestans]
MDLAVAYCVLRDTEGTEPSCGTVPDEQFRAKRARGRAKRDAYRERNEHAQRRGASQERSSSAARETAKGTQQPRAPTTVDTGGGVVVTLETSGIRPSTGRTPMNLSLVGFTFDGEG